IRPAERTPAEVREDRMNSNTVRATCCVAGGGPAGIMAGFLLARAGVRTIVLERHKDFFRDFRGDTIHPSTLQIMHELGLLDAFLKLPHSKVHALRGLVGDTEIQLADFSHLPTVCKYIALMPQWDFLNFLAEQGRRYPGFDLHMETEATDLIVEGDRVVGLRAQNPSGPLEIRADLAIGADGRHSTVRERARSEEHTSELQSQSNLVCRLLLEKKKTMVKFGPGVTEGMSLP